MLLQHAVKGGDGGKETAATFIPSARPKYTIFRILDRRIKFSFF